MVRVLIILAISLSALPAAAQRELAGTAGAVAHVARTHVEKKYAIIDRNLKSSAKFRLSFIIANIYDTIKNGKQADFHAIAKTEIAKQFSIATAEQKDVLAFFAIAGAMKKVEADIEEMRDKKSETSTIFFNLNVKANELFDILSRVYKGLKGVSAKTVVDIL